MWLFRILCTVCYHYQESKHGFSLLRQCEIETILMIRSPGLDLYAVPLYYWLMNASKCEQISSL